MTTRPIGPRVFLIGPHGSGKSSIGRSLTHHGYQHISIGALRRLALRNKIPADIPARLLFLMARHVPGTPLPEPAVALLIDHMQRCPRIVVDGFPATVAHLAALGDLSEWSFVYAYAPRAARQSRLLARAETTPRGWVPGRTSERDLALPALCRELRVRTDLAFFNNSTSPLLLPASLLTANEAA